MKEKLREFGFSEKEVAVYLALLELGSSVVSSIAKRAKINRSTTYVILQSLSDRRLIRVAEERGVKVYSSTPPEKLVEHLEGVAKQYANFAGAARKLVPELKSLHAPLKEREEASHPKVRLVEGHEGVKTIYEDTLASLETIRAYASVEHAGNKAKKDVKVQVIFPDTPEARTQIAESKEEAEEEFRIPSGKFGFSSEINIYDRKVIFIAPTEKFGLVIESREFADTLKKAFVSARKEAKFTRKSSPAGKRLTEEMA